MASHYSASGWLPVTTSDESLIDLVAQGAAEGEAVVLPDDTEYRVLTSDDERFELWLFAAHGQVRGASPYVRGNTIWDVVIDRLLPRVTGGMGAVEFKTPGNPDQVLCCELPDYGRFTDEEVGKETQAVVTGLAYMARTVPEAENGLSFPRLYPYGVLNDAAVTAGEGSRCDVLACGRITSVARCTNMLTNLDVWILDIDIEGLILSVCAAPVSIEGEIPKVGRMFEGVFWLTARIVEPKKQGALGKAISRMTGN